MIISVGLDGCLLDYFEFVKRFYFKYCESKSIHPNFNPMTNNLEGMLGLSKAQYADFMATYGCKKYYLHGLRPDSKEVLDNLCCRFNCKIAIISGRSLNSELSSLLSSRYITSEKQLTLQMIQSNNLPIKEEDIWSGNIEHRIHAIKYMRPTYILESDTAVIEGIREHYKELKNTKNIFVMDNPWNRELQDDEVTKRIYSLNEFEYCITREESRDEKE